MRILLDTHVFLWWVDADPRLSPRASELIADPLNTVLVSVASGWEIAIKAQLGKLVLSREPAVFVPDHVARNRFEVLPIRMEHALAVYGLPMHHKDPFDRLLVAQSLVEATPLIGGDPLIAQYPAQRLW